MRGKTKFDIVAEMEHLLAEPLPELKQFLLSNSIFMNSPLKTMFKTFLKVKYGTAYNCMNVFR